MRLLIPDERQQSPGEIIGYVIGVLYFFGMIYYIYRKHLLSLFQMFMNYLDDNENEEQYKAILYSCLNSIQFLILCFYSTFSSESDLAVSTIIGSDAFMIFFVFSYILYKYPTHSHGVLDTWITIRDAFFYILSLFVLFICILLDFLNIGTAVILLVVYFANIIFIFNSENVKSKMMEWFDLTAEDEDYSCEQHLTYVKRRISITHLKDNNYIQTDDPTLIKKLALNNKASSQKSGKLKLIFQKIVYIIIFAIKNQVKQEKQFRVEYYLNMYKPKQRGPPSKKSKIEPASSVPDSHHQNINEDIPLMENNDIPIEHQKDQEGVQENDQEQEQQQQQEQEGGKQKLTLPKGGLDKFLFILFFPAHLICHFIPTPKDDADYVNIILDLLISLAIVTGLYFLIDWWIFEIFDGTGIPIQVLGFIFLGVLVSTQLAYHQIDIAKEELQLKFTQAFFQTAICKSSLCMGITWGIQSLINIDTGLVRRSSKHSKTFAVCIIIVCGLVAFLLFQCWLKRFILAKSEAQKYMVVYCLLLIIIAVIVPLDVIK
ncbi:unnamed protein product (macronuclear) [Paramecium tetraurelia]|uniref:Sodium/calcium exchanger membrane region domain-containing protein n=1 Tax=Paramecium tetraurelia TaxID=5888 RepID=A0CH97_PARTE|nr:uncharacterized protein GSPATT00007604001 [Paramecium tetraurelia]CAK70164.1 unnamed protein product [Paramecium tetraurelia]|eukprot:XP_001437561.1 hypothetical protein (macronuclear) [Paramecium tetraurelia strain d4-2]